MTSPRSVVGLIGPGRAGIGLALALTQAGYTVRLHGRKKKKVPSPLTLTVGDGETAPDWVASAGVVILAVRDDGIRP
ncbi:MAG TPA: NAD(P)-binding domain-containing protein, partial [Gemmatimonadales bacterium]|nr:NAD(P)-binding domain-containing protein [Gemmatimonadales bacterium]